MKNRVILAASICLAGLTLAGCVAPYPYYHRYGYYDGYAAPYGGYGYYGGGYGIRYGYRDYDESRRYAPYGDYNGYYD